MLSFLERTLLLPSALLVTTLSHALCHTIDARDVSTKPTTKAISFAPDQEWDGIDGSWSTFTIRVGTPQQSVRTFVSWASYQTWVVLPPGCDAAAQYAACARSRGGVFNQADSSTWNRIGIYDLWIENNLGDDGNALFGYETVGLGGTGNNEPTLKNTTVGGFAVDDFYLGVFGINPKPTNFTTFNDPSPSYMALLKEQKYIPSISFGYTAGASYRGSEEFASLTLGGYDSTKYFANNVEWTFAPDNERDIVVSIQSISTPSQIKSSPSATELLPSPIYAYMDATVPQIWLPVEACYVFEYEFGLVYDNYTQLYLVNDTLHQQLLNRNASITFQLALGLKGGDTVSIELPYAAFDLQAKAPYQGLSNETYYFPLRRALNESQYTIGRTFFQEAYITVDYESQKFNVSQRAWNDKSPRIVAIPPYTGAGAISYTPSNSKSRSGSLTGGAIAGIVVGAIAVLAILGFLLAWYFRRRSASAKRAAGMTEKLGSDSGSTDNNVGSNARGAQANVFPKAELPGSMPFRQDELDSSEVLAAGAITTGGSSSDSPVTPHTPHALSAWARGNVSHSPTADSPGGSGTHSSQESTSRGTGTMASIISPLSPSGHSEADSKERQIAEMPGDMPPLREKDGKQLSEKEALAHRERVINGVDTAPQSAVEQAPETREPPRRIAPEDVVMSSNVLETVAERRDYNRHRAFSFEDSRTNDETFYNDESTEGSDDLYS